MFRDRVDAGRQLAEALRAYRVPSDAIVLGIPRGGVIVAAEVARDLGLRLGVALAAKVGAPGSPEYAIGAVAEDGVVTVNPAAGYSAESVRALAGPAREKIAVEASRLRGGEPGPALVGRVVLLVDDGFATGLTAMAAADWLKRIGAAGVVAAAPVAPPDTIELMRTHADEVVVVEAPERFGAVGRFYSRFEQTDDAEVIAALAATASPPT